MKKVKPKIQKSQIVIAAVLILIVTLWTVPTLGVFITSFRDSKDIYSSGWWSVLPHKDIVKTVEIELPQDIDPDGPITLEGHTANFNQWREGIEVSEGRILRWYGNKRSRIVEVYEKKWVGFGANLTLSNYRDVLAAGTVTFEDAQGNQITRQGNNFADAVLNSIAVSIPATVIPILIAAFAAYAFEENLFLL